MTAQPAQPATRIALLDVSYIFQHYARFKSMMGDMKLRVQQAEQEVKDQRQQISKMAEELQQYNKGTDKYNELEGRIADLQARLAVNVDRQKRAFLQDEARIYYNVYQEICQSTDYFCQQYGIDLVLRFNREKADPNIPDTVLTGINQPVVFQRGLDITKNILDDLNSRSAPVNPGAADRRGGVSPRPASPFGRQPELDRDISPPR